MSYDELLHKQSIESSLPGAKYHPGAHQSTGSLYTHSRQPSALSYYERTPPKDKYEVKNTNANANAATGNSNSNPNMTFQSESGTSGEYPTTTEYTRPNNNLNLGTGVKHEDYMDLKRELVQMKKQLSRVIDISLQKHDALELKLKECLDRVRKQDERIETLEFALKYRHHTTQTPSKELSQDYPHHYSQHRAESRPIYGVNSSSAHSPSPFSKARLTNNNDIQAQIDRQIDRFERFRHKY